MRAMHRDIDLVERHCEIRRIPTEERLAAKWPAGQQNEHWQEDRSLPACPERRRRVGG
jgi:hypothetical protein